MTFSRCRLAVASLLLASCGYSAAQSVPPAAIVLPKRIVAGQAASLAVLDSSGALSANTKVEFEGGESVATDATGRATFTAPGLPGNARSGVLVARIAGTDAKESTTVLPDAAAPAAPRIDDAPPIISIHDRFTLTGTRFRAEVDVTRAWLQGKPAMVLAASPLELVILPSPHAEPGPTELFIESGDVKLPAVPITLATLEISSDKPKLAPREKGKVRVRVRGTEQRVEVEVRNQSPDVVTFEEGLSLRAYTKGGEENIAEVELIGKSEGDFSLSARLMPMPAGAPNVEAARQKLIAARRAATGAWSRRLDDIITRMEQHPEQALKFRDELEKMLAMPPPLEVAKLIEQAWLILIKK